jgi:hypothetical protein
MEIAGVDRGRGSKKKRSRTSTPVDERRHGGASDDVETILLLPRGRSGRLDARVEKHQHAEAVGHAATLSAGTVEAGV